DRTAALQIAFAANRAGLEQQRFQQQGLPGTRRACERDVPDALCRIPHGNYSPGMDCSEDYSCASAHALLRLSNTREKNKSETAPDRPPPQEDPMHDVPVYPENDPPPGRETDLKAGGKPREGDEGGPPNPGTPSRGKDEGHDVDDDDLDP